MCFTFFKEPSQEMFSFQAHAKFTERRNILDKMLPLGLLLIYMPLSLSEGKMDKPLMYAMKSNRVTNFFHDEAADDLCRFSDDIYMRPEVFKYFSCSSCYYYMSDSVFKENKKFDFNGIYLWDTTRNMSLLPNISDTSSPIWETFASPKHATFWKQCCEASDRCCDAMLKTPLTTGGTYCPRTWDGWGCWPDTPNDTVAEIDCPPHVYHHLEPPVCTRSVARNCTKTGSWYRNHLNHEWSNYTLCSQQEDVVVMQQTHIIALAISIALLFPAILIFMCYKQLHVFRVVMHRNLFISVMLTAIFVIVFEAFYMSGHIKDTDTSRLEENSIGCKVFYSATKYLRISNYMWMLCEGLYLHRLITAAFAKQKNILKFYVIGWGLPLIPVGIWVAMRQTNAEADTLCWTVPYKEYEWIILVPMLLAFSINFILLVNILRVITMKLSSTRTSESTQFRRAVRATAALVPLFGIHFFLFIYQPQSDSCFLTRFFIFLTYAVDGLQGAIIAVLFCYLNQEVINLLMRSYTRKKLARSIGSQYSNRRMISRESRLSLSTNAVVMGDSLNNITRQISKSTK